MHNADGTTTSNYRYPATGTAGPHRLSGVDSVSTAAGTPAWTDTYGYDQTGNTTSRTITSPAGGTSPTEQSLHWDPEGKLHRITVPDAGGSKDIETNYYDPEGTRLIRRDATATTLFLGDTEIRIDRTTGQTGFTRHYSFDGRTIAVRDGNTMADVQVLIPDAHNTAGYAIENGTGNLLTRRSLPYGAQRGTIAGTVPGSTWATTRGFVNGTTNPATDLTTIGARTYDPNTGRFISIDPILDPADPQQVNGYTYANNNPMAFSDPTGLKLCGDDRCTIFVNPTTGKVQGPGYENGEYVGGTVSTGSSERTAAQSTVTDPWVPDMQRLQSEIAKKYLGKSGSWDQLVGPEGPADHLREYALQDLEKQMCERHSADCSSILTSIAAAGIWVILPKTIVSPHSVGSAELVRSAVDHVLKTQSTDQILSNLSNRERLVMEEKGMHRVFYGTALHRATAAELTARHGTRFGYSSNAGPDFYDRHRRVHVELTTRGQVAAHVGRGGAYPQSAYVAYDFMVRGGLR